MGTTSGTAPVPLPLARTGWLYQCKPPLSCKGQEELASCPEVELKNVYVNPIGRMQQERAIMVREICFRGRKELGFFQLLSSVFFLVMKRRLPCCVMAFRGLNYPTAHASGSRLSLPQCRAYAALHWHTLLCTAKASTGNPAQQDSSTHADDCTLWPTCLGGVGSLILPQRNTARQEFTFPLSGLIMLFS